MNRTNRLLRRAFFIQWLLLLPMVMMADVYNPIFTIFNASDGLADNSAHTIHCTKTGRMVITTMGQINFFDGVKFTYIDPTDEYLYSLKNYRGNYHLYFDKYHHLWLKNTHSVTCVNLTTEKFVPSVEDVLAEFGINQKIDDIFICQDGVAWLLYGDELCSVESKKTLKIRKDLNLQDLEICDDKQLLLFYENGLLDIYDLATCKVTYSGAPYGQNDAVRYNQSSLVKQSGSMFFQVRNGKKEAVFMSFNVETKEWKTLHQTPYHLNGIALNDSLAYLPSEYGYWVYDCSDGQMVHHESVQLANGQMLQTDINVMGFDRQGGLWAGTQSRGLLYARPYNSPFTVLHWSDKRTGPYYAMMENRPTEAVFRGKTVNSVLRDSRGWVWVGTSKGLLLYRSDSDRLPQVLSKRDGLLNNVVHSIVEDHLHHIWVSTSYGITCVEIKGDEIGFVNSYNRYDYIPNETFVNNHAICLADGTIVMQSLDHIVTFNPEKMKTLDPNFNIEILPKLIKILVNGTDVRTGDELDGNVILDRAVSRIYEINLNYDQNSIVLTFSSLNYFRPQQSYYRLRVRGLDEDWTVLTPQGSNGLVDSRGQLHLPLMGLKPGSYVIELQVSMRPDVWVMEPYEWVVNVHEPWWRTTGMFALMGLVLVILFAANVYYYLKNANLRALRNSEERNLLNRIYNFASRSQNNDKELEPIPEEIMGDMNDSQNDLTPEFIQTMIKIMPYVLSKKVSQLTMRELSEEAGIDVKSFYSLISNNIFKSPRMLILKMTLQRAKEMMDKMPHKSIGDIAEECGFVSPNFFIAAFYRTYQMTPSEYRQKQ